MRSGRVLATLAIGALCGLGGAGCDGEQAAPVAAVPAPGEVQRIDAAMAELLEELVQGNDSRVAWLRSARRAHDHKQRAHDRNVKANHSRFTIANSQRELAEAAVKVARKRAKVIQELLEHAHEKSEDDRMLSYLDAHRRCEPVEEKIDALVDRESKLARTLASQQRQLRRAQWSRKAINYNLDDVKLRKVIAIRRKYDGMLGGVTQGLYNARLRWRRTSTEQTTRRAELAAALKQYEEDMYLPAREKFRTEQPEQWKKMREEEEWITEPQPSPGQVAQMEHADSETAKFLAAVKDTRLLLQRLRRELKAWRAALAHLTGARDQWAPQAKQAALDYYNGAGSGA